jgi:hypothetical protein
MLSFLGVAAVELATGRGFLEQAASPAGAASALALMAAVTAASLAPALLGKVPVDRAFPSVNDSYPNTQLPYVWTAVSLGLRHAASACLLPAALGTRAGCCRGTAGRAAWADRPSLPSG